MNWFAIIQMILSIIAGFKNRVVVQSESRDKIEHLAHAMVEVQPELKFDCLLKVLPDFLNRIMELVDSGNFLDYKSIVKTIVPSIVDLVRCQQGIQAEANTGELTTKILSCGIDAAVRYFTSGRDLNAAISGFFACLFAGGGGTTPPPGGGGGGGVTPPPGPGPTSPVLTPTNRC